MSADTNQIGRHGTRSTNLRLRTLPWHIVAPVACYLVLAIFGITLSSVGIAGLRQDPAHPHGLQLGESLSIRADEFLTSSPLAIGVTATGSAQDLNALSAAHGFASLLSDGPVSSIVLFDGAALRLGEILPDASLFAARWWLPVLLVILAAPAFFMTITGSRRVGYLAAGLIIASPVTAWWSLAPLGMTGFTLAGAAALQRCAARWDEGRPGPAVAWGLASAVLLARTPLHYQPWSLVIAIPIIVVTIVALLANRSTRRTNAVVVLVVGVTSLALFGGVLIENWASFSALTNTAYPGARVSTGTASPLQEMFGATSLGAIEGLPITGTNDSEISSSFTVAAIWAALLAAHGLTWRSTEHRTALMTMSALTAFWFFWTLVDFGGLGERLPLINLVPPQRATDVLGYLAVLLVCLALPGLAARNRLTFALLCGMIVTLVAANAGSLLRANNVPDLSLFRIWFSSALAGAIVTVVTWRPEMRWPYPVAAALAFSLVWQVNPVLVGLGDLRVSPTARMMLATGTQLRDAGEVWVSDNMYVDSLMIATGVPALSGRQLAGPEPQQWRRLAPTSDELTWNRGGSYILFAWSDRDDVEVSNPGADVIQVETSPCTLIERMPEVSGIVTSKILADPCVTLDQTFTWSGTQFQVYIPSETS